jgi:hypothetical protein
MRPLSNPALGVPRHRTIATLATLLVTTFALACGDSSSTTAPSASRAPTLSASFDHGASGSSSIRDSANCVQALLRLTPLEKSVTYSTVISSNGGTISVPEADFELQVPSGAFSGKSMTFTVTAYAGSTIAYDFQPHGVVFRKPLKAVQRLDNTNWGAQRLPKGYSPSLTGAYFSDTTKFNIHTGWGIVDEFMSTNLTDGGTTVIWEVPHFSGYIVASGRQ